MDLITAENLTKSYGSNTVLNNLNFTLPAGEVIGLFGPNGCGKTTMMKILTGLIHDYEGTVRIKGEVPGEKTKAFISYLPEQSFVHDWMRNVDAVNYYADFFRDFDRDRALKMLEHFNLPLKQKCKSMSKGQQEKLVLSLVLSRRAELYILDEPLGGVDPAARNDILDFIMNNYAKESTLLISTHLISDLQSVFTHAVFLGNGQVLLNESADDIRAEGKTVEQRFMEVFAHVW